MGVLFSCPADDYDPLDLGKEEAPPTSAGGAGEPAVLRAALGSGKLRIEGSLSFKRAQAALQVETEISIRTAADDDAAMPAPGPGPGPLPRASFAGPVGPERSTEQGEKRELERIRWLIYHPLYLQKEREDYEVVIEDGRFLYKKSGQILDTSSGPRDAKWIFVLSTSKNLYVGQKKKGTFQHSSFLAGGATSAAGRLVVENGTLKAIWPHSGHYRPTEDNFQEFKSFLNNNSVDLTDVKMSPEEEDEEFWGRGGAAAGGGREPSEDVDQEAAAAAEEQEQAAEEERQAPVPREKILQRINSKKGAKSYQLGKQLSFKWTTGAGPRIGCVRDYPSELQLQALEQVNLSPRCAAASRVASPLGRGFNNHPAPATAAAAAARGCEASTPTEALRSPLQHGALAVAAAAE